MTNIKELFSELRTRKLYALLLSLQILDLFALLVLSEIVIQGKLNIPMPVVHLLQFTIILALNLLAVIFIKRFVQNRFYLYSFIFLFLLSLCLVFITETPAGAGIDRALAKVLSFLGHVAQFTCLCLLLAVITRDIFQERHDLTYSLTGATCIFILIGTIFGILYSLFEILSPGMIFFPGSNTLRTCIIHSFYILSGQESPVENLNMVIRNLSIFESIFANLYAVMVVGKLMSK